MDWGIDPARVAEISTIASSRRFSARDTEKFVLAITGGGSENADLPLWDMLQVLFSLGALTANPRMPARDAAIGCMLDEGGILLRPLRQEGPVRTVLAGATIEASAAEIVLSYGGKGDVKTRSFSWSRIRRALGLADFLFAAEADERSEGGLVALRTALDATSREKDSRMRVQKQECQSDPTGVLGCTIGALGSGSINTGATLASIVTSKELYWLQGLPTALALDSVYGPSAYGPNSNPTDPRQVNTAFTPTCYSLDTIAQVRLKQEIGD
eukprot:gene33941-43545_t